MIIIVTYNIQVRVPQGSEHADSYGVVGSKQLRNYDCSDSLNDQWEKKAEVK